MTEYEIESRVSEKRLSRRQYIKYAGAGAAAVALASVGCYGAGRLGILNRTPVADFEYVILSSECQPDSEPRTKERTLRYIRPNSDEEITFPSNCLGDHYSNLWYMDGKIVGEASDHSAKLSPGEHTIRHVMREKGGMLKLLNRSDDPDAMIPSALRESLGVSGEIEYSWMIDDRQVTSEKDYSLWLPSGEHNVRLNVSDRMKEAHTDRTLTITEGPQTFIDKTLTVDPANLPEYPEKKLRMPIKGINLSIGCSYDIYRWPLSPEFPPVPDDELLESLYVIRHELGCNGVRLFGNENERMLNAVQIAKDLDFHSIMCSPRYVCANLEDIVDRITPLAEELETLKDDSVILNIGNELSVDAYGLVPGETYDERVSWHDSNWTAFTAEKQQSKLNDWLESILQSVRPLFRGKLSYSPIVGEEVKWNELGFDVVSANIYYSTFWDRPEDFLGRISNLCSHGRPTYITEFGYYTFEGCLKYGGGGWAYLNNPGVPFYHGSEPVKYSQDAQAKALDTCMTLLKQTRLAGIYLYALIEKKPKDIESDGITKFNESRPWERKKAFYLYKSYQRSP